MKGNFHVQFLGEGVAATSPPYPTPGWATTQVYPAQGTHGSGSCATVSYWRLMPTPQRRAVRRRAGYQAEFLKQAAGMTGRLDPTVEELRATSAGRTIPAGDDPRVGMGPCCGGSCRPRTAPA